MDDHDADFDTRPGMLPIESGGYDYGRKPPPRRTPDAELREAVARLCDACDALVEALGDLPEPAHHRYRVRRLLALGAFQRSVRHVKAALLLPEKMP